MKKWTSEGVSTRRRWHNVALMLARRLRRRANIKPTLGQRLVFADYTLFPYIGV